VGEDAGDEIEGDAGMEVDRWGEGDATGSEEIVFGGGGSEMLFGGGGSVERRA
jgi:hypothetical protein